MKREDVLDFLGQLTEKGKEVLQICKNHDTIAMLLTGVGILPVDLTMFVKAAERFYKEQNPHAAEMSKDVMGVALRMAAKESQAFGVFLICEAWFRRLKKGDVKVQENGEVALRADQMPRNSPERMEILSISFEVKLDDGTKFSGMRAVPFTRIRDRILFDPPEDLIGSEGVGRFCGIIE